VHCESYLKHLLLISSFVFICQASFGQDKEFEPTLIDFPNLNPDTLSKYEALSKEYDQIVEDEIPYDSLTAEQLLLMSYEMIHAAGPYFTGELGCSWYCAGGPSRLLATTMLDSTTKNSYKAENAHDFDLRTAWIEGKKDYGIDEQIDVEFELSPNLKVTHVIIYNGYSKSLTAWNDNSRVKTLGVYVNSSFLGKFQMVDTYLGQRFDIGSLAGDGTDKLKLTFRILDVYQGDKYSDTAISEINFDGTGDH
jgi:hypothetical protein